MTDKEMTDFRRCMEAQVWYNLLTQRHQIGYGASPKAWETCATVIMEAYMMRADTLTRGNNVK